MKDSSILEVTDWTATRGARHIFGPIDLRCKKGQITTIMGPSGVGKTTLLLTMLGFREVGLSVSGQRNGNGQLLTHDEVPQCQTVYIPQNLPFNPSWRVRNFLCRLPWGERPWWHQLWPESTSRKKRVEEVLIRLGLSERMHATAAELSGGEAQRAALAQLLLLRPELFVADEFVSAIDPGIARWILDECRCLISELGGTALLALHDVHAALHVSDRIILLLPANWVHRPWVIEQGSPLWDADALHALLCVGRWIKDMHISRGAQEMLRYISAFVEPENNFQIDVPKHPNAMLFEDDGSYVTVPISLLEPLQTANQIVRGSATPLRGTLRGRNFLGLTLPCSTRGPFTMLAYAEPFHA